MPGWFAAELEAWAEHRAALVRRRETWLAGWAPRPVQFAPALFLTRLLAVCGDKSSEYQ